MASWWYNVKGGYDHFMNRIEKERCNAERMGLQLVVQADPFSSHYVLYATTSLQGKEVELYNETGIVTVKRERLEWNGSYLWLTK